MKLGVIILAHKLPEQLSLLARALEHPSVTLYVHLDQRSSVDDFLPGLKDRDVHLVRRYRSYWADPRGVDAALDGLRAALTDSCDYCVLISGQDLPVVPISEIVGFFERNRATSFLRFWPLEETNNSRYGGRDRSEFYSFTVAGRRELCVPPGEDTSYLSFRGHVLNSGLRVVARAKGRRIVPAYVRNMRGDEWWNVSRAAGEYALDFVQHHPDFRAYHQHTFAPDELFFPTIMAGSGYEGPVVNESLRYIVPGPGFHPKILRLADLQALRGSTNLFGRKFDITVDKAAVHQLLDTVLTA